MTSTERVVAGWILEERLGSGGFGEVWKAHRRHGSPRALKLIRIASEDAFDAWRHEISRLEDLSHPNIVRFYDADVITEPPYDDHAWIATELCDRSLAGELQHRDGHVLREDECVQLLSEMLAALAAAHASGCVHRDVKPANILRHHTGVWKLCDFGTARLLPTGATHPHTRVVGTSPYMSAAAHSGRQDHGADLYALGVTVHEALSGQRLHPRSDGISDTEYAVSILKTPPTVSADLPGHWTKVVEVLIGRHGSHTAGELALWFDKTRGASPPRSADTPTRVAGPPTGATAPARPNGRAGDPRHVRVPSPAAGGDSRPGDAQQGRAPGRPSGRGDGRPGDQESVRAGNHGAGGAGGAVIAGGAAVGGAAAAGAAASAKAADRPGGGDGGGGGEKAAGRAGGRDGGEAAKGADAGVGPAAATAATDLYPATHATVVKRPSPPASSQPAAAAAVRPPVTVPQALAAGSATKPTTLVQPGGPSAAATGAAPAAPHPQPNAPAGPWPGYGTPPGVSPYPYMPARPVTLAANGVLWPVAAVTGRRMVAWLLDLLLVGFLAYVLLQAFPAEYSVGQADGVREAREACDSYEDAGVASCIPIGTRVYVATETPWRTWLTPVAVSLAVGVVLQGRTGWTPGKLLVGLRTVPISGQRPGLLRALGRWMFWILDALPVCLPLVGLIALSGSRGQRRLGDRAVGTWVVPASVAKIMKAWPAR